MSVGLLFRPAAYSLLAALLALVAGSAFAQKSQPKIDITSNTFTIYEKEFRAVFLGKVDALRGKIRVKTDRLDVDYNEVKRKDGSKKTDIRFLKATGNVVIISGDQTIKALRARMDVKAERAVITGNVRVYQGKSTITGEKLHLNLANGRSRMEGRVRGQF